MTEPFFFEDVEVGQRFATATATITAERIKSFGAEFDPQPQHLSEATARDTPFGELVASGWHTGSLSLSLMIRGGPSFIGSMGLGLQEVAWPIPVRPGDTLRVETEILEKRPSRSRPDRGLITMRSVTLNQRDEAVMTVRHTVMASRRG